MSEEHKTDALADALNALAKAQGWHARLALPRILTPHPAEMGRLIGVSSEDVQAARLTVATRYANQSGSIVVLKGACTIVAHPDGRARLSEAEAARGVICASAGNHAPAAGAVSTGVGRGSARCSHGPKPGHQTPVSTTATMARNMLPITRRREAEGSRGRRDRRIRGKGMWVQDWAAVCGRPVCRASPR